MSIVRGQKKFARSLLFTALSYAAKMTDLVQRDRYIKDYCNSKQAEIIFLALDIDAAAISDIFQVATPETITNVKRRFRWK
jgi:hypothetical protein